MTFSAGDRVTYSSSGLGSQRHGTLIAGESKHAMNPSTGRSRPSYFVEIGPGFALVQFDGQKAAQIVSVDHLEKT